MVLISGTQNLHPPPPTLALSLRRTRCSPRPARCSPAGEAAAPSLPPTAPSLPPTACPPPTPLHTAAGGTLLHTAAAPPPTGAFSAAPSVSRWSCRCRPNPTGGWPFRPRPNSSISWRCRRQEVHGKRRRPNLLTRNTTNQRDPNDVWISKKILLPMPTRCLMKIQASCKEYSSMKMQEDEES
ncbi:translation initiation factor IF-2-like [Triticum dicoccoides]|uniref:translation initiation factor IF-2-like n=1 Tax=Triticum dicoccoides TaxID=85692 RepID=UPI0018906C46|nr:translation initiation factor IF-2-like [Triticum dicoccoides]